MQEILGFKKGSKIYEIRLLICVAQADGYIDEIEKECIFRQVQQDLFSVKERQIFHDDIENPKDWKLLAEEIAPLINWSEKLFLTRKLFKLASKDNFIQKEETDMIYQIARTLGIDQKKIQEIENWVIEGMDWAARWSNIVSKDI
ncbi:MAG TPA: hypothetical protein DDY49_01890 [Paenibacillaceae bacterium]|nr:hypothetical protein [Paenibacillaceae bacterium]